MYTHEYCTVGFMKIYCGVCLFVCLSVPLRLHLFWALFSVLLAVKVFLTFFCSHQDFKHIFSFFLMFLNNVFCCSCRTYHSFLVTLLDVTLSVQSLSLLHHCFEYFFVHTKILHLFFVISKFFLIMSFVAPAGLIIHFCYDVCKCVRMSRFCF